MSAQPIYIYSGTIKKCSEVIKKKKNEDQCVA